MKGRQSRLSLERSLGVLRRRQEKKMWAERVGDAVASNNKKMILTHYAEWKLAGKRGGMEDFLKEVARAHEMSSKGISMLLKRAARQEGRAKPRKRL